jgi:copper(I)-binding protein
VPFRLRQEAAAAYGSGMKKLVPALCAATFLLACERMPAEPSVSVEGAVVTAPAVPGGAGAAYFTLRTNNDPSRLVSVTSPMIGGIELHETREQGGSSQMSPLKPDETSFDPSAPLIFAPGGKHAMLMGMDPALRPGGKVTLIFNVDPVGQITAEAEVRGPGQAHAQH